MRFEEMEVWRRSTSLCIQMYRHFRECRDFGFKDQITRSALSVPSNIAEAMNGYLSKIEGGSGVMQKVRSAN